MAAVLAAVLAAVPALLAATLALSAAPAAAARHVVVQHTGLFHIYQVSHSGQWLTGIPELPSNTALILDRATGGTESLPFGDAYQISGFVPDNPDLRLEVATVSAYAYSGLWLRSRSTGTRVRVDTDSAGSALMGQWMGPGGTYLPRIVASPNSVSRDGAYVALCVDDALGGRPWLYVKNLRTGELKQTGVTCGVMAGYGVMAPQISYDGTVVHVNGAAGDPNEREGQTVPDYFLRDTLVFPLRATLKVRTVKGWGSMTRDGRTLFLVRGTRADGARKPWGAVGAYSIRTKRTKALAGRYRIYGNEVFRDFSAFDKASFRGRFVVRGDRVAVVDRKKGRETNIGRLMRAAGSPPTAYVQSRISGDGKVVFALTPSAVDPTKGRGYVAVSGW